jgi:leader peptidase (prepilin peptidase)/N-methyltransferase
MMIVYYIFAVLFGLASGSFINVCIYRIPRGESLLHPSSHCTSCNSKLGPFELIPVFSFIFLGGKCRHCGARISVRYPIVEAATAAVYVLLLYKYGLSMDFVFFAFLFSVLIAVFFIDIDHRIIPDELVLTALAGGVLAVVYNIFRPLTIYGDRDWWNPLLGILPGSGFLLLIAIIGILIYKSDDAMGMGDVKIFAPIGLFLGWRMCIVAFVLSVFLGGLTSIILMTARLKKRKDSVPFGPFIVMGTFITVMWGREILLWYLTGAA